MTIIYSIVAILLLSMNVALYTYSFMNEETIITWIWLICGIIGVILHNKITPITKCKNIDELLYVISSMLVLLLYGICGLILGMIILGEYTLDNIKDENS